MITLSIPIDVRMPSASVQEKLARLALDNAARGQSRTFVRMGLTWGAPRPPGEARQVYLSLSPCDEEEATFAIEVSGQALAVRLGDDE